jgi:hypothetical protein
MKVQMVTEYEMTDEEVLTACKAWIKDRVGSRLFGHDWSTCELPPSVLFRAEKRAVSVIGEENHEGLH